jgi:hypothetical protein
MSSNWFDMATAPERWPHAAIGIQALEFAAPAGAQARSFLT